LAKAEIKTNKISLAIPDSCAKVAIHHFDSLPGKEKDKIQLLKWKLKKTLPFNVDDSHLSYLEQRTGDGKHTVVTVSIHKEVLAQYEGLFAALGIHVGYVTLASFAAFELLARSDSAALQQSVLYMRVRPAHISSLIVQQGAVVFFRHVDYEVGDPSAVEHGPTEKVSFPVTDLYDEVHPCLMYYQDKLGASGVEKIYLSDIHDPDPLLLSSLSQRSGSPVLSVDPLSLLGRQTPGDLNNRKFALTPAMGLALGRF
jgi:Tfp pilus assembly PilM family ATPase